MAKGAAMAAVRLDLESAMPESGQSVCLIAMPTDRFVVISYAMG